MVPISYLACISRTSNHYSNNKNSSTIANAPIDILNLDSTTLTCTTFAFVISSHNVPAICSSLYSATPCSISVSGCIREGVVMAMIMNEKQARARIEVQVVHAENRCSFG